KQKSKYKNKTMEDLNHPESNEKFLNEPSKVLELMQFLDLMLNANKMEDKREGKAAAPKAYPDPSEDVTDKNFYISSRGGSRAGSRMSRRSTRRTRSKSKMASNTNQFTFMRQIEQTEDQRLEVFKERERVANNFRRQKHSSTNCDLVIESIFFRQGNVAYCKDQFNYAIELYSKGMDYIPDSPVLYINRACCYIKLRNFKMAIMDCNHVLCTLDPKYLRAFLYRAFAYKRMGDEKNFEQSIDEAKRVNSRSLNFIETFLERMRTA
ncbi:hypothetical protein KR093_008198, partial [Drosophila rubida]